MNYENQTDLWRQFEDADKERDAHEWADGLKAKNPDKTIGEIVCENVHNDLEELKNKKHVEKAQALVETKNNLPTANTVEEESDVDKPAEEYYGRFNKIAQEKLDASYRKRKAPSKRQSRQNPEVFDKYK